MRYGFVLPGGTATEQLEQAVLAERAGWDGVFWSREPLGPASPEIITLARA